MSRFSFIDLLNEGDTSDDFHKEHKLETEHTSFKHRRIAESEIVKPRSKFTFADFLKSQNVELTEPAEETNSDYHDMLKEIDDSDYNEIDTADYNEVDDSDYNEIDTADYNEVDDSDYHDMLKEIDDSDQVDTAETETEIEVLRPVEVGQEQSIQSDLLNNYAKIDDLDNVELNIKIIDPETNEETELETPNVLDKLNEPLNINVVEPEEPKQEMDIEIEIAKPEETSVEVKSSDDVNSETNDTSEETSVEETSTDEETKETSNVEETK